MDHDIFLGSISLVRRGYYNNDTASWALDIYYNFIFTPLKINMKPQK